MSTAGGHTRIRGGRKRSRHPLRVTRRRGARLGQAGAPGGVGGGSCWETWLALFSLASTAARRTFTHCVAWRAARSLVLLSDLFLNDISPLLLSSMLKEGMESLTPEHACLFFWFCLFFCSGAARRKSVVPRFARKRSSPICPRGRVCAPIPPSLAASLPSSRLVVSHMLVDDDAA